MGVSWKQGAGGAVCHEFFAQKLRGFVRFWWFPALWPFLLCQIKSCTCVYLSFGQRLYSKISEVFFNLNGSMILFCDSEHTIGFSFPLIHDKMKGKRREWKDCGRFLVLRSLIWCSEMPRAADVAPALTILFFISHVLFVFSIASAKLITLEALGGNVDKLAGFNLIARVHLLRANTWLKVI